MYMHAWQNMCSFAQHVGWLAILHTKHQCSTWVICSSRQRRAAARAAVLLSALPYSSLKSTLNDAAVPAASWDSE